MRQRFLHQLERVKNAIRDVPCDDPDTIFSGASPFQTYRHLRAICSIATTRVELFDPYLGPEVFHLYLADCDEGVKITVVTSQKIMDSVGRSYHIVAVSKLLAAERPDSYRLLVTTQQHDRHLRVDDKIYHLGGSVKDLDKPRPYTLANLDTTEPNEKILDDVIAKSEEWFGPTTPEHREQ